MAPGRYVETLRAPARSVLYAGWPAEAAAASRPRPPETERTADRRTGESGGT
jgi:hypothetical protein